MQGRRREQIENYTFTRAKLVFTLQKNSFSPPQNVLSPTDFFSNEATICCLKCMLTIEELDAQMDWQERRLCAFCDFTAPPVPVCPCAGPDAVVCLCPADRPCPCIDRGDMATRRHACFVKMAATLARVREARAGAGCAATLAAACARGDAGAAPRDLATLAALYTAKIARGAQAMRQ